MVYMNHTYYDRGRFQQITIIEHILTNTCKIIILYYCETHRFPGNFGNIIFYLLKS